MDAPLWTETYAPTLEKLPQENVRRYLERATDEPINLILQGPPGSGKTAAARALARETYGEDIDNDLIEINVADFFNRTKTEIKNDPRFEGFLVGRSSMSKRDMINHVLKESASYAPVSGEHKTVLLDNAEDIREDFQQALRRIMEKHHRTTQFIIGTRQPTKLIPPIRSRCFPVRFHAPDSEEIVAVLERIVEAEDVPYETDGLEFVAGYANGNLRQAILAAQTTVEDEGELTMSAAYETIGEIGRTDAIESMLDDAEAGEFTDARKTLDDLLVDEGLDGDEILENVLTVGRKRYQGEELARLHKLVADTEFEMQEGSTDRIHVSRVLAELGRET